MTILNAQGQPISAARKRVLQCGTLASGATETTPLIETSPQEVVIICRWIEAAEKDIISQVETASKDSNLSKKNFEQVKYAAECIATYLATAKMTCDGMLAQARTVEDDQC